MSLSCFSLDLFGLLPFFSLKFCRGVLLDNPNWMMVGELSAGLIIEDGDRPICKKGNVTIHNIRQSCDQNFIWCNFKQTSKSTLFEEQHKNEDFTVQSLSLGREFLDKKKKFVYMWNILLKIMHVKCLNLQTHKNF